MSEGRVLHLRCFLEGIEVPITSCSVSASIGAPASAHIELLDSELAFELLPRTLIHVFFFDDMDGKNPRTPSYFADTGENSKISDDYKLLFFGEVFSVFHNKSGYGSRNVTIMALDASNVLDTHYIFQINYSDSASVLGRGDQAAAQFTAASAIGNNPFDNILGSPQRVVQALANQSARSPIHSRKQSKLGGLLAIFELLLGVDGYAMGINLWTTVHEKIIRLIDMIDSDDGATAKKLFDQQVFNEWLTNSIGNEAASMSYRQLAQMIMDFIYYDMVPIPTASYFKPDSATKGRDIKTVAPAYSVSVDAEYRTYFSDSAYTLHAEVNPTLLSIGLKTVQSLRNSGYIGTKITSAQRTGSGTSRHLRGLAIDVDDAALGLSGYPSGIFSIGIASLTAPTRISLDASQRANRYLSEYKSSILDVHIVDFLINRPETVDDNWKSAETILSPALFGGSPSTFFQFLTYVFVAPFMENSEVFNYQVYRKLGYAAYLAGWKRHFEAGTLFGTFILGGFRFKSNSKPLNYLKKWAKDYSSVPELARLGQALDSGQASISSELKIELNRYFQTFWVRKIDFYLDYADWSKIYAGEAGATVSNGATDDIVRGYNVPIWAVFGLSGDDPVHLQLESEDGEPLREGAQVASYQEAINLYDTKERMTAFLLRPDVWMCAPPRCNVIFPEDIISLNISRDMIRQTTRLFLMTYNELFANNVLFNGHYFAPQFDKDVIDEDRLVFGMENNNEVIYPHEVYSGIVPKVDRLSEVAFYSRAASSESSAINELVTEENFASLTQEQQLARVEEVATDGVSGLIKSYASNVAHFNLLKQRFSATRITVNARFLARLIPGLPAVVIGQRKSKDIIGFQSTHTWLGMIESVQHSYSQGGATTSISLSTCRPYKTGEGSIDELLKLKNQYGNLFKNQDPSFATRPVFGAERTDAISFYPENGNGFLMSGSSTAYPARFIQSAYGSDLLNTDYYASPTGLTLGELATYLGQIKQAPTGQPNIIDPKFGLVAQVESGLPEEGGSWGLSPIETDRTFTFKYSVQYGEVFTDPTYNSRSIFSIIDWENSETPEGEAAIIELGSSEGDGLASQLQTKITSEDVIVASSNGDYKKVQRVNADPTSYSRVGYVVVTWDDADDLDPSKASVRAEASATLINKGIENETLTVNVFSTGKIVVRIPVMFWCAEFSVTLGTTIDSALDNTVDVDSIPLEEALMPAWFDTSYSNGIPSGGTINTGTGIGSLYRRWFGCSSIVDGVAYDENSGSSTVSIEQAVNNLIEKYKYVEEGKKEPFSTYEWTKRNIATLTDLLAPPDTALGDEMPLTGGFHSHSFGDYDNLQGLGLNNVQLRSGVGTDTMIQIPALTEEQKEKGITLDPRKGRRSRVIAYRDDVIKSRGKTG